MLVRTTALRSRQPAILAGLAGLFLLSSCGFLLGSDDPQAEHTSQETLPNAAQVDAAQDCLLVLWDRQPNPNREFDRAHDEVEGGAISCATGTTPSEFAATLAEIRAAAASNDRAALVRKLNIPLLYIDSDGERHEVPHAALIEEGFDDVFSPKMLRLMQELELEDMTVVPDQGAFFELGSIWLVASEEGGRPRLVTVNRQALDESIAAAREAASAQDEPPAH